MRTAAACIIAGLLACAPAARAEEDFSLPIDDRICVDYELRPAAQDPLLQRIVRYTQLALKHRVDGLASYYSTFFDGRKTANGEIYRNAKYSAAHLTLPLGTWIEVTSRATGRKLRLRVNDRGPYAKKFCLDLSQAAARYLGVDRTEDRHVDIRIIALPGEEPLPEEVLAAAVSAGGDGEAKSASLAQH
ncbi:MAG TPA: septal ring lytic transglycosylase RlpA family protein [Thermoanaerobaculia bacterium]|nr:septal ring lytic transglycosylase RlpA family protein [Thermoanaerobaculia bacterium]